MREHSTWKSWSIFAIIITVLSLWSQHYIFPNYSIDFNQTPDQITAKAQHFANTFEPAIDQYENAIQLNTDYYSKFYLEKTLGSEPVAQLMRKNHHLYYWSVRFFKPNQQRELTVNLSPSGKVIGFVDQWPQSQSAPSVSQHEAREKINDIMDTLGYSTDIYQQMDASTKKEENHLDHSFGFKSNRHHLKDNGYFKIEATVSGNQVTKLLPGTFIPQTWTAHIQQLETIKNTIAHYSSFAAILLMIAGIVAILWFWRQGFLASRFAALSGCVIGGLYFLAALNQWPHIWMNYVTTQSKATFIISWLFSASFFAIIQGVQSGLLVLAGEAIYRKTAPKMAPLSILCSFKDRSENGFFSIINGYLLAAVLLGFISLYYFITTHLLENVWLPTNIMVDHNILATFFPWLSPLANALSAGLNEELLFRAIPLGGTLLLIKNNKLPRQSWVVALFIQAFLWACLHVTYPAEPFYIRIIELSIVGLGMGLAYQRYGLFPVIFAHFLYDFAMMIQPIVSASMLQSSSIVVVVLGFAPLLWGLYSRYSQTESGQLITNQGWLTPKPAPSQHASHHTKPVAQKNTSTALSILLGLATLGMIAFWTHPPVLTPKQPILNHQQAQKIAHSFFKKENISFDDEWTELMRYDPNFGATYTTSGTPIAHSLLMHKINPGQLKEWDHYFGRPGWNIAYKRFNTGTPMDRMETYTLNLTPSGEVTQYTHTIPQNRTTTNLTQEQALKLYKQHRPEGEWKSVEEKKQQVQSQTHWFFTSEDLSIKPIPGIQPLNTVHIVGDKIVSHSSYLNLSDSISYPLDKTMPRLSHFSLIGSISWVIMVMIWAFCAIRFAVFHLKNHRKTIRYFFIFSSIYFFLTVNIFRTLPWVMSLSRSISSQLPLLFLSSLLWALFSGCILAIGLPHAQSLPLHWNQPRWKSYLIGLIVAFSGFGLWSFFSSPWPSSVGFLGDANAFFPSLHVLLNHFTQTLRSALIGLTVVHFFNQPSRSKTLIIAALMVLWTFSWHTDTDQLHSVVYASLSFSAALLLSLLLSWRFDVRALLGSLLGIRIIQGLIAVDRGIVTFSMSILGAVMALVIIEWLCRPRHEVSPSQ